MRGALPFALLPAVLSGPWPAPLPAQTLARPGWAGSGLTAEAWWHSAIFYRIDPHGFQDSNGDGVGDMAGIAERLEYLQSLGIDAMVLQAPFDTAGFDELVSEASRHHIRVVVQLAPHSNGNPSSSDAARELTEARTWLARGVAGIDSADGLAIDRLVPSFLANLRHLADSFPGGRVVLVGDSTAPPSLGAHARHSEEVAGPELADVSLRPAGEDAFAYRAELARAQAPRMGAPLLAADNVISAFAAGGAESAARMAGLRKITATVLLASGDAALLTYGQELGLDRTGGAAAPLIMQWTPRNVTAPTQAAPKPKPHGSETVYGAYTPYVPPPSPKALGGVPAMPSVTVVAGSVPEPVDPNSLPGFTAGHLPARGLAPNGAVANVAVESGEDQSLLTFYRRLAELRHGYATLRSGSLAMLDSQTPNLLAWVRRPPAGARTVASVLVACNLSDHAVTVSVDPELDRLHVAPGSMRPLLASASADNRSQNTDHLTIAPWGVYIGEITTELPRPSMARGRR